MSRIKYKNETTGEWFYADMAEGSGPAPQPTPSGPSYDLLFTADTDNVISPDQSSITVDNVLITAISDMEDMLDKVDDYGRIELVGSFNYADSETGLTMKYPPIFREVYIAPNAMLQQLAELIPDIGSKDGIIITISPAAKWSLYYGQFLIYESTDTTVKFFDMSVLSS